MFYNKIAMNKQKRQITHREINSRNPAFSEKIQAKKPLNFYRKPLAGQQSAHRPNRIPQRELLATQQKAQIFQQQSVKNSSYYRLLLEEMKTMTNKHQVQISRLKQVKQEKQEHLKKQKQQQYNTKMQIWQLKNEVMQVKQSIKTQRDEMRRLQQDLGIQSEGDEVPQSFVD